MLFCPLYFINYYSLPSVSCKLLLMKNNAIDMITLGVRAAMVHVARILNRITRGKIKPSHITTLSLLGHIPAAWALWYSKPVLAAGLIAVFGLMDALDGALAREQKSASKMGMFFDATTDRLKEVVVYSGLAVYVAKHQSEIDAWVVPALIGTSLLVSYVKAKGEMAISTDAHDKQLLNRAFSQGIASYEVRMALLILGLVATRWLSPVLNILIALNLVTAAVRFLEVARLLNIEDNRASEKTTSKKTKK
jgi:CDP-diacylglycerol---glycerol-3-phosphate 3-phosphatidyltransferase